MSRTGVGDRGIRPAIRVRIHIQAATQGRDATEVHIPTRVDIHGSRRVDCRERHVVVIIDRDCRRFGDRHRTAKVVRRLIQRDRARCRARVQRRRSRHQQLSRPGVSNRGIGPAIHVRIHIQAAAQRCHATEVHAPTCIDIHRARRVNRRERHVVIIVN